MDKHTRRVLEFDKILHMASSFAFTFPGRSVLGSVKPIDRIEEIKQTSRCISECRRLISEGHSLGLEHFDDFSMIFKRIRPADAVLESREIRAFLPLFYSALHLKIWSNTSVYPGLVSIISQLVTHKLLAREIDRTIEQDGTIRDEASPELSYIRDRIKYLDKKIKTLLEEILNKKELRPHLQDFYITHRNTRWVIPLKRDSKGSVPGVVHDISNTGESLFIEPFSTQQLGNELESLRAEEKLEVHRILKRLSSALREHVEEIEHDYHIVARVDSLQAMAQFADQMNMNAPEINEKGTIRIVQGRHPLLWKTLKKESREDNLVPLDLDMGSEHSGMVITGSNAGGKTVALKTVGVLHLMALSGMHIPAASETDIPFLKEILADIGDEQSIEQNLSTFSAHIRRISEIIRKSRSDTLVLIDELGTGTDPEHGGALSCAILRELRKKKVLSLVSTHLDMIKAFAHSEEGFINSAMEMEKALMDGVSTFRPTYRMSIGKPGRSHALEIAESLGLDTSVVGEARKFIQGKGARIESLIGELEQKSRELDESLKESEAMKTDVAHFRASLEEESAKMIVTKKEILSDALRKAEEIVRNTKKEARDILDRLKKADNKRRKGIMRELDNRQQHIMEEQRRLNPHERKNIEDLETGQRVFINSIQRHGIVKAIQEKLRKCTVAVDEKEILISVEELSEPVGEQPEDSLSLSSRAKRSSRYPPDDAIDGAGIKPELNVIGQRVDPALSLIERYINDALLSGMTEVRIIHGIGSGILARAVRDYVKSHPLVERFRKGNDDEGGEGVTVIQL